MKARKIRARPQRLDGEVLVRVRRDFGLGLDLLLGVGSERVDAHFRAQPLADGNAGLGIDHVGGDLIHQMLEILAAPDAQEAPSVACRS